MNLEYLNFNINSNLTFDKSLGNKISILIKTDFFNQSNFLMYMNNLLSSNEVCWIIIVGNDASFWEGQLDEIIENLSINEIKYLDIVTVSYDDVTIDNIDDIVYEFIEISGTLNNISLIISFLDQKNSLDCLIENKIVNYLQKV